MSAIFFLCFYDVSVLFFCHMSANIFVIAWSWMGIVLDGYRVFMSLYYIALWKKITLFFGFYVDHFILYSVIKYLTKQYTHAHSFTRSIRNRWWVIISWVTTTVNHRRLWIACIMSCYQVLLSWVTTTVDHPRLWIACIMSCYQVLLSWATTTVDHPRLWIAYIKPCYQILLTITITLQ